MVNFTVKGIPGDLYDELKRRAARNRRSVNGEILVRLEEALGRRAPNPADLLARIDALRERLDVVSLTETGLREAKDRGRR